MAMQFEHVSKNTWRAHLGIFRLQITQLESDGPYYQYRATLKDTPPASLTEVLCEGLQDTLEEAIRACLKDLTAWAEGLKKTLGGPALVTTLGKTVVRREEP